jgi:ribosomal protein S10
MKFRIFLKSFNNEVICSASQQLKDLVSTIDCKVTGIVALPVRLKR